jgi:thioredoxin 1
MSNNVSVLTDASFDEEVKSSDVPVLVDFWAEWCGPCKMIAPILEQVAEERTGQLRIAKVNVDDNLGTAQRFDIRAIPTMILFKDGEPVERIVGATAKGPLLQKLQQYL